MDVRQWFAEVAKAVAVRLLAGGIERAIEKAAKPVTKKHPKHLR